MARKQDLHLETVTTHCKASRNRRTCKTLLFFTGGRKNQKHVSRAGAGTLKERCNYQRDPHRSLFEKNCQGVKVHEFETAERTEGAISDQRKYGNEDSWRLRGGRGKDEGGEKRDSEVPRKAKRPIEAQMNYSKPAVMT